MPEALQINIDAIFKKRNPKVYRFIPKFLIRWIERLVHQEQMNAVLFEAAEMKDLEFNAYSLQKLGVNFETQGTENVPLTGGVIVAANHPLGGVDGMGLIHQLGKIRTDVRFIVNDLLQNLPNYDKVFIGVNKLGASPREQILKIESLFNSDNCIAIFPAGICSRKTGGIIIDLEWQKSFIAKARKYGLPIIPTFISGNNTNRFYRISNWRKFIGIKMNIEMMFLPDEMWKQQGKTIGFYFGTAIAPQTWDKSRTDEQWAQLLKQFVYTLPKNPKGIFTDFIKTFS